jgi:hypothetical protein
MLTIDHQVPVFARGWGGVMLGGFVDLASTCRA